jgi:glycosyltransferase involved in cell wall biosynthesis
MTTRVLVVTADVLRPQMAGPAMRAWHIAAGLAAEGNQVRLVTTSPYCEVSPDGFDVQRAGPAELVEAERWCDVMLLQGYVTHHFPDLGTSGKILVFDLYDPLHLETLALTHGAQSQARNDHVRLSIATLNDQLARADFLLCASERQRDLWLGQLCALGRVNPVTYDDDPNLRRLIDVVPFGLPDEDPQHQKPVLRGVFANIGPDDHIVVWAGGVYDWFDPLTVIHAVHRLSGRLPAVRLVFMGTRHPNPDVPEMQMMSRARALAEELGVAGHHVFFNEGWTPYADRQNYLLEADVGVTAHFASSETRFAFRTRALDYLWAGLPVVSTQGDFFAELIENEGLGLTVPAEDVPALEEALYRLLTDEELGKKSRSQAGRVRQHFRWSVALEPLVRFCRQPRHAPDLASRTAAPKSEPPQSGPVSMTEPAPAPARGVVDLARYHYRAGGFGQVANRAVKKALRLAGRGRDRR